MRRIINFLIFGAIGGFVGWMIVEPINALTPGAAPGHLEPDPGFAARLALGAIIGLSIGLFIGLAQGRSGLSLRDSVKTVLTSVGVGLVGGMFGFQVGSTIYGAFSSPDLIARFPGPVGFLLLLVGRAAGWAILGVCIGAALGIGTGSTKILVNGAVGGLLGGGICGAGFEVIAQLVQAGVLPFTPAIVRMITLTALGASIGLFIGLIQELAKQAWVRLMKGRNEGKEFLLYKPLTIVGRDELADIPVFGDTSVAPQHAVIEQEHKRYVVRDLSTPFGTSVNGSRISEHILKDGDVIELGSMKLLFCEKATASRMSGYAASQPAEPVSIPTSSAVCPYCGGVKDADGNCRCTVGAGAPSQSSAPPPFDPVGEPFPPDPFVQPAQPAAGPSGGPAKLTGMAGAYGGKSFTLGPGETSVGRDGAKDIPLSLDRTVSRNHARITEQNGAYFISDEGSSNGTIVNGTKITQESLKSGDIVQIGSTKFRFEE